jgi:hypothetical protein
VLSPGSGEMSDSVDVDETPPRTEEDEMRQFVRFCDDILVILNNRWARVFLNAIVDDDKFIEENENEIEENDG